MCCWRISGALEQEPWVAAAAQKAQAADAKRTASAGSAAVTALQAELTAHKKQQQKPKQPFLTRHQFLKLQHEHELLQQQCITLQQLQQTAKLSSKRQYSCMSI